MAKFTSPNDYARVFDDAAAFDRKRKADVDARMRDLAAAAPPIVASLLDVLTVLPAATITARRAEYERVVARYGAAHARARQIEASLVALEGMDAQAAAGRTRARFALDALAAAGTAFAGFVTDTDGAPLAGMTVELTGDNLPRKPRDVTANDGRFRIPLPPAPPESVDAASETRRAKPAAARSAANTGGANAGFANVRILNATGRVVYEDPARLQTSAGSAYREYRIGGRGNVPAADDAAHAHAPVRKPRAKSAPPRR